MLRPAQKGKQRNLTTVRHRPTRNKALFYSLKARCSFTYLELVSNSPCFSLCTVSFVPFRGVYYITRNYYSLSVKLVAALIVSGECGAETLADNNNKTVQYIFPLLIFPSKCYNHPSKTSQARILNFDLMNLPHFLRGQLSLRNVLRTRNSQNRPYHF